MTELRVIEVGQLYRPDLTELPEGAIYSFSESGHELLVSFASPTREEINAIGKGKANFGLTVQAGIIFLLWQFRPLPWQNTSYCYWMLPIDAQAQPYPIEDGEGAFLRIVLIDAMTGIVKAIRAIGLGAEFSHDLHRAISDQIQNPITPQDYYDLVQKVDEKFPNSLALLRVAEAQY